MVKKDGSSNFSLFCLEELDKSTFSLAHQPKGKSKAELDKAMEFGRRGDDYDTARQRIARLELENERLRQDLELAQAKTTRFGSNIYSSTHELDRIHDRADKTSSDLRRCQAELRVTQADSERARAEAQALQEKLEKSQVSRVYFNCKYFDWKTQF